MYRGGLFSDFETCAGRGAAVFFARMPVLVAVLHDFQFSSNQLIPGTYSGRYHS